MDRTGLEGEILFGLLAVTVTSLGLLVLTLRDTGGRFSVRILLLLTAYVAAALGAAALLIQVVHRSI